MCQNAEWPKESYVRTGWGMRAESRVQRREPSEPCDMRISGMPPPVSGSRGPASGWGCASGCSHRK